MQPGGRRLPKPPPELRREREPLLIIVQKDADFSFMPFNTGRRDLDLSRFDTGGVENAKSAQQLSTYLFSDRGIYRPGETTHLGAITRTADWKASLDGLPLDLEITDPRGTIVSRSQLTRVGGLLRRSQLTPAPPPAPTGTYEAVGVPARATRSAESCSAARRSRSRSSSPTA